MRIPARTRTATLPITAPAMSPGDGPDERDEAGAGVVDLEAVFAGAVLLVLLAPILVPVCGVVGTLPRAEVMTPPIMEDTRTLASDWMLASSELMSTDGGIEVAAPGSPVITPRLFVCVRRLTGLKAVAAVGVLVRRLDRLDSMLSICRRCR